MPTKAVYLLVVPGFADWEPAHAVAELRRHGHYRVVVVGLSGDPVQSMGGLTVQPACTVASVNPADVAVFILPGGDRWEQQPLEPELKTLLCALDESGVPIAAICAATVAVARAGLIRGRLHTSNGLDYLRGQVSGYTEQGTYVDAPAVRDRGLITASGLADVEFASAIMTELGVLSSEDRALWTKLFRSGLSPVLLVSALVAAPSLTAPSQEPPARVVVLSIDINNLANQPIDSGLPARVEALGAALRTRLAACGYEVQPVDPQAEAAARRAPGYLYAHPDLATTLAAPAQADWVIASRLDRATPWVADLQALVIRVRDTTLISNRVVELKGLELTPELGARLVDRGAAWMADQVSQAIEHGSRGDTTQARRCPA
jgi:putative intracellular protease/amidase